MLIDVRTPEEYTGNHAPGAVNIPIDQFETGLPQQLAEVDKSERIVVYCRSGSRASLAKQQLEAYGFSDVVNGINAKRAAQL